MNGAVQVTEHALLEGSWLALQQAGTLLRTAVSLYNTGSYPEAVALAMSGREEIGRSKITACAWNRIRRVQIGVGARSMATKTIPTPSAGGALVSTA
jgi:hypothetical protein